MVRRPYRSVLALATLAFGAMTAPAAGQDEGVPPDTAEGVVVFDPALEAGTPIRVTLIGVERPIYGRFVDVDRTALRLREDGSWMLLSLPVQEIDEVAHQVIPPDRTQGAFRGGMIAGGAAILGGALLQLVPTESPNMAIAGGVFLAMPLGAIGAVIGRVTAKGEYEPVRMSTEVLPPPPIPTAGEPGSDAGPAVLDRFGELVAGTWESADSRHVYEWGVGRKALRSRSYFPDDDEWRLVSEGFWYAGQDGGVRGVVVAVGMPFERMEYESRFEGDRVIHDLRTYGGEAVESWVETWRFSGDTYTWTLEWRTGQGLEPVMDGEYQRVQQ